MLLKSFLNTDIAYTRVEDEIRQWVETVYPGLSIEFGPKIVEIVRTGERDFSEKRVRKITERVNAQIDIVLEKHAEEIYIGERLDRIWKRHPDFNPDVSSIEDVKHNPLFLKYLDELILR